MPAEPETPESSRDESLQRPPGWRAAPRKRGRGSRVDHLSSGPLSDTLWAVVVAVVVVLAVVVATVYVARDEPDVDLAQSSIGKHLSAAGAREVAPAPTLTPAPVEKKVAKQPKIKKLRRQATLLAQQQRAAQQPFTLRVATFNILGTQHTAPGGTKGGKWPSSSARMPGALASLKAHNVSVVGLQEVQPDQMAALLNGTGWHVYPGSDVNNLDRVNPIMYDPSVYEFVDGSTFQMSNGNGTRAQPILKLRHIETQRELYFINSHPPAGRGGPVAAKRMGAFSQLVQVVNGLKAEGLPVILTGDMNDRAAFFCRVVAPAGMVASAGGSTAGGCRPPAQMPVDWIAATADVTFSNHVRDESVPARRISDHYLISATATIGAAG